MADGVSKFDKGNMIGYLRDFPSIVKSVIKQEVKFPQGFAENMTDIVILGMGGSGFIGDLLKVYRSDYPIDVHVVKGYSLPKYVDKNCLVFAISYSGNTEETISAYRSAIRRGCNVISISSGGKLEELSKMHKIPHIRVLSGIQPRLSTPLLFIPILHVLSDLKIIEPQEKIIESTVKSLKAASETVENAGKDLAGKLKGKIPIIYASSKMFCLAEKWKTDINENAKTHCFYNMFPEFNHNEICGYTNPNGNFHVVIISDTDDHEKVKKRINVFKKTLKPYGVPVNELAIKGDNLLTRLLSTIWMGFYVSYYLAIEYETDPTPVEIIEKFKKQL